MHGQCDQEKPTCARCSRNRSNCVYEGANSKEGNCAGEGHAKALQDESIVCRLSLQPSYSWETFLGSGTTTSMNVTQDGGTPLSALIYHFTKNYAAIFGDKMLF